MDAARRQSVKRMLVWTALAGLALAGTGLGMQALERHVLHGIQQRPVPVARIVLIEPPHRLDAAPEPPGWMPASVLRRIEAALLPPEANFNDPALTAQVYALARTQPSIRKVLRVSRRVLEGAAGGVVDVQAELRQPIAQARHGAGAAQYVDAEGVVIPADEVAKWVAVTVNSRGETCRQAYYQDFRQAPEGSRVSRLHYILVQGLAAQAPGPGQTWPGQDIRDGLESVRLILPRPYAREIVAVDVSNHAKRRDRLTPEITWLAQVGDGPVTEIRFGRFPLPGGGDWVVSLDRRMDHLDQYVADHHGTLAGLNKFIDLRYDKLSFSLQ